MEIKIFILPDLLTVTTIEHVNFLAVTILKELYFYIYVTKCLLQYIFIIFNKLFSKIVQHILYIIKRLL